MDNRNNSGENTTQPEKSEKLRLQFRVLLAFSIATTLVFEIRMLDFIEGVSGNTVLLFHVNFVFVFNGKIFRK